MGGISILCACSFHAYTFTLLLCRPAPIERKPSLPKKSQLAVMADLEAVLADVSYLMAMERSKTPAAKTIKKVTLPDARSIA